VIERVHALAPLSIPYVPGLLSFREGGPIIAAFEELSVEPDLVLFDGSGRIHFRQAGIATHLGVVFDVPSVGVAKSLLCGRPRSPVDGLDEGARVAIEADGRVEELPGAELPADGTVGYAVQTRQYPSSRRVNPLYVSAGHRVSAESAASFVLALSAGYKLPEPVRLADRHVGEVRERLLG
jgi:deoxyribonuclease V